jgi:chaperonin GroEL
VFKAKLTRRVEILSGGVAVIRVGAQSDTEKAYLKLKVEDAKNACKCALQEGMVAGGGLALSMIADKMGEDTLLFKALQAPGTQIIKNAGHMIDIPDNIKDPAKVVRCALENAVSVAKILITTETIIADKRRNFADELKDVVGP